MEHRGGDALRARVRHVLRRRPDTVWAAPPWLALSSVVLALAVHASVAWGARSPVNPLDEMVMVGYSRLFSGQSPVWEMAGSGFAPGLALLMTPAWWFTTDADVVYQVGLWIALGLAVATIWPLSLLARHTRVPATTAVVVASVILVAPAPALTSHYLMSESLFVFVVAWTFVAAARFSRSVSVRNGLMVGGVAGMTCVAHGRGIAIVAAVGLWLVTVAYRRWGPLVAAALAMGATSAIAAIVYLVSSARLLTADERLGSLGASRSGADVLDTGAALIGQIWYATFAWPLILVVGGAFVVRGSWRRPLERLLMIATVVSVALATHQLAPGPDSRLDVWVYGRYSQHMWLVLATLGLALVVRHVWPALVLGAVAITAAVGAAFLLLTVPRLDGTAPWEEVHFLGLAPWLSRGLDAAGRPQPWGDLIALSILFAAGVGVLSLVRFWVLPALAVMWTLLTVSHDQTMDLVDGTRDGTAVFDSMPAGTRIGVARNLGLDVNSVLYNATPGHTVVVLDADDPWGDLDVVIVPFTDVSPEESGAVRIPGATRGLAVGWLINADLLPTFSEQGLLDDR